MVAETKASVGQYYQVGLRASCPPSFKRPELAITAIIRTYDLPNLNEMALKDLSLADLEELRARLQIDHHLSLETVRKVIDGSLLAMMRDAPKAGIMTGFRFSDLKFPRRIVPGPDPLTEEER